MAKKLTQTAKLKLQVAQLTQERDKALARAASYDALKIALAELLHKDIEDIARDEAQTLVDDLQIDIR